MKKKEKRFKDLIVGDRLSFVDEFNKDAPIISTVENINPVKDRYLPSDALLITMDSNADDFIVSASEVIDGYIARALNGIAGNDYILHLL